MIITIEREINKESFLLFKLLHVNELIFNPCGSNRELQLL